MAEKGTPRVTVLMAAYNAEDYLNQAIDSILSQTFSDFEFLILDDGSTDRTPDILADYASKDRRLELIHNNGNVGTTRSLNKGLALARGEYIARMDADDVSLPHRLEKQVEFLDRRPDVGVVGCQMEVIDEADKPVGTYEVPCDHSMIVWKLLCGRSFAHPSVMIRAAILREAGGYDPSLPHSQDFELWTRLTAHTRFANLPEIHVRYRTHPGAISRQRADVQRACVLTARRRFLSRYLGREADTDLVESIEKLCSLQHSLNEAQIRTVLPTLLEIAASLRKADCLTDGELGEIQSDIFRKAFEAGRRLAVSDTTRRETMWRRCFAIPRAAVSVTLSRWGSLLPVSSGRGGYTSAGRSQASGVELGGQEGGTGITVIVLSFRRMDALASMLKGLLNQDLGPLRLELVVCNNAPEVHLKRTLFSRTGRLLRRFADVKVINSGYNWRCSIRYYLAMAAKYETVLFLDDDIVLLEPGFIRYMYGRSKSLRPVDLLSCWNNLWVDYADDHFTEVSLSFQNPLVEEVVETDTCGMGICMFNKGLLNAQLLERAIPADHEQADDMAFPLVAWLESGSRSYFLPSYEMLKMHPEHIKGALFSREGHYDSLYGLYKSLLQNGYQPVLSRGRTSSGENETAEQRAARLLPKKTHRW